MDTVIDTDDIKFCEYCEGIYEPLHYVNREGEVIRRLRCCDCHQMIKDEDEDN